MKYFFRFAYTGTNKKGIDKFKAYLFEPIYKNAVTLQFANTDPKVLQSIIGGTICKDGAVTVKHTRMAIRDIINDYCTKNNIEYYYIWDFPYNN